MNTIKLLWTTVRMHSNVYNFTCHIIIKKSNINSYKIFKTFILESENSLLKQTVPV